jgi:hypothetical protein
MSNMKNGLKTLYGSKLGKLIPVFIIAGLVATASAAVFVNYYGSATATVASSDIHLVAGSDTSSSSSYKPTVSITNTSDLATIGISLLPSDYQSSGPQPSIYYTDLLEIHNGAASASHTINSISITNIVDSSSSLGEIDVYYCTSSVLNPVGNAACAEFAINPANIAGGSLSGNSILPAALAHGATGYVEIVGHANQAATVANTITFDLQVSWV